MKSFSQILRATVKYPLVQLLECAPLRRRIIFELRQRHYGDLETVISLGGGLQCPVCFWEAWASFSHIFFEQEYAKAFQIMPAPARWIDLGSYAGYFSLYLACLRQQRNLPLTFQALLVDADSRCAAAAEKIRQLNGWTGQMEFCRGLIGPSEGEHAFVERSYMTSSARSDDPAPGRVLMVPRISASELMRRLPPPYDLIKADIEGGEYHLLTQYQPLLRETEYFLLEWHSWHPGGGGQAQLRKMTEDAGFEICQITLAPGDAAHRSGERQSGVHLYRRKASR